MKIAFCSDFSHRLLSGVTDSILVLMEALRNRGHVVRLYCPSLDRTYEAVDDVRAFPCVHLPFGAHHAVPLTKGFWSDIRDFRPDIVHSHTFGIIGIRAVRIAHRLRVPLLGTSHTLMTAYLRSIGMPSFLSRFEAALVLRWYYNRCLSVTVPSRAMETELRLAGVRRPVAVVSNPIDAKVFRPLRDKERLQRKFGIRGPAVLSFGRLAPEKNIEETLESIALLAERGIECQLVIVGDGPLAASLKRSAHKRGIADRVRFMGTLRGQELAEVINAADLYVLTSRTENQPLTTMQAMACGLPVVCVAESGVPELVRDGGNGFLVNAGDTKMVADRIAQLLTNPSSLARMGQEGHACSAAFSPAAVATRMEELYGESIESRQVLT